MPSSPLTPLFNDMKHVLKRIFKSKKEENTFLVTDDSDARSNPDAEAATTAADPAVDTATSGQAGQVPGVAVSVQRLTSPIAFVITVLKYRHRSDCQ